MAHVEYGCPFCGQRILTTGAPVSDSSFAPSKAFPCKNCLAMVPWQALIRLDRKTKLEGLGGSRGIEVVLAGKGETTGAPVTQFTITGVRVAQGQTLVLCFTTLSAAAVLPPALTNVLWGSSSANGGAGTSVGFSAHGLAMTYIFGGLSGSQSITVDFVNADKPTSVSGVAFVASGLAGAATVYDGGAGCDPASGNTAPIVGGMSPSPPIRAPALIVQCHSLHGDFGADAAGSWDVPSVRVGNHGNGTTIVDVACQITNSKTSLATIGKAGFTDREWGLGASYLLGA